MAATTTTSTAASAHAGGGGPLNSDHINYLILRYLQESGFEDASKALWRDWHRRPEYKDPEDLPFAPDVKRHELISVIQDGVFHDELQARRRGFGSRRFQWTGADQPAGSVPRRRREEMLMESGERMGGSRPGSRGKRGKAARTGGMAGMRAPDEFPTPAAKRQRRSDGGDVAQSNGDGMELDAKTPASAEAEGSLIEAEGDAVSPNANEQPEAVEVVERYDSMDVATQTDVRSGPKTSTMYWRVNKKGASILHAAWAPPSEQQNGDGADGRQQRLWVTGGNLCRSYRVPKFADEHQADPESIDHHDEPSLRPNSMVTAMAWHPDGKTVTYAIDGPRDLPGDVVEPEQYIVDANAEHGTIVYPPGPPLQDPAGIVLKVEYNPSGSHLFVLRSNPKRGLIQIYATPRAENGEQPLRNEPVAWRICEHQALDAVWAGNDAFVVCGSNGLLEFYELAASLTDDATAANGLSTPDSFTAENIATHGLKDRGLAYPSQKDAQATVSMRLDKLAHDSKSKLTVCAAMGSTDLVTISESGEAKLQHNQSSPISDAPTGLAFRPATGQSGGSGSSVLAVTGSYQEGVKTCRLFEVHESETGTVELKAIDDGSSSEVDHGPGLAPRWSPDGQFLAVANTVGVVQIWKFNESDASRETDDKKRELVATWRSDRTATAPPTLNGVEKGRWENGAWVADEHLREGEEDEGLDSEPCLGWSPQGNSLVFAKDQQIAVIRFRPPLSSLVSTSAEDQGNGGNGDR